MYQRHFGKAMRERPSLVRSLLVAALGIGLAGGVSARAEAQTYQLTNIGVISGATFSFTAAMDDSTSVIRVTGTSKDKFGNSLSCWYWDTNRAAGSPLVIGPGTPTDVNSQGEVVGRGPQVAGQQEGFYWKAGLYTKLPYPATTPDGTAPFIDSHMRSSSALGINEAGVICGHVYREDLSDQSVIWQKVGGVWQAQYLKPLSASASNWGYVAGINEAGDIAGTVSGASQAERAVVWKNLGTPTSPVYDVPTDAGLPTEGVWGGSWVDAINNSSTGAQVLGAYHDAAGAVHRFVWTPGTAPVSFDAAGPKGLSDDGAVTGWTYAFAGGATRAYYFKDGAVTDCGSLGGGVSFGHGVSSAGEVVGESRITSNGVIYAFVWKAGVMKNLGNLVTGGLGPYSRLDMARKIGKSGAITGEGIVKKGGYSQAYVLLKSSP
jgi:probable HAF family extracellular repeat protein